ncbi:MAG: hypothetical protein RIR26_1385 [Pseudomonadota bacterium]|jgi:hypothetical protein
MQRREIKLFVIAITFFGLLIQKFASAQSQSSASELIETQEIQEDSQLYVKSISSLGSAALSVVDLGLKDFNEGTLPHQAKDLRKQIVRLRDIMDVFSHNFSHEMELWNDIRDGLDDGYTVVGEFKDLFDTNSDAIELLQSGKEPKYKDEKKIKERRSKVLKWKRSFFAEGGLSEKILFAYLDIRPLNSTNVANSKKYSDFFWGGVSAIPSPLNTPAENARVLVDAQSEWAREEHQAVLEIKDPSTVENEIIFHDHRKRLRTISKVCTVANALTENTCHTPAVKEIEKLVVEFGEIEDLIVTGRHFEEDGKKSKAKDAYEDARKRFKILKKKFDGRDMLMPLFTL